GFNESFTIGGPVAADPDDLGLMTLPSMVLHGTGSVAALLYDEPLVLSKRGGPFSMTVSGAPFADHLEPQADCVGGVSIEVPMLYEDNGDDVYGSGNMPILVACQGSDAVLVSFGFGWSNLEAGVNYSWQRVRSGWNVFANANGGPQFLDEAEQQALVIGPGCSL
ncbi:MAG: hypothetical protein HN348_32740, partial [Proteobacteria bacterium]|nr:hypothetical protein [Pseudomonadota bacterium]